MTTTSMNAADAKEQLSELLNRVSHHKERIIITRRDKEIAALVTYEDYLLLQTIQDKSDLQEAIDALKEARNTGTIPLQKLQEDLG